ncbi:MAG: hypothetical protein LBK71_03120 [Verrucomicrobiales bacterium]|jgi:hypothetical protein|nr:hypothetical protein [Verrucomicrobiales bacterium]
MSVTEIMREIDTLPAPERRQILAHTRHTLEPNGMASTPWLRDLLRKRRDRVTRGEARLRDWDTVKFNLGRA